MKQEMVTIPKKEYEALLEEIALLSDSEIMGAIRENEEAKKKGIKSWKLPS